MSGESGSSGTFKLVLGGQRIAEKILAALLLAVLSWVWSAERRLTRLESQQRWLHGEVEPGGK